MIFHPEREKHVLTRTCGGRLLEETFGLVGEKIADPENPRRFWTVNGFYLPLRGRSIGGVRIRLVDQKGFATFCNQRDFEVLAEIAAPGDWCEWLGKDYVSTLSREWLGLCLDSEDLRDDLFAREADLRAMQQDKTGSLLLDTGIEMKRFLHLEKGVDVEELLYLRGDVNPYTGQYPDMSIENIDSRWTRIERNRLVWRQI